MTSENLLAVLGRAIALAAIEARSDIVGELAAIVSRLAGEERTRTNVVAGVAVLDPKRVKRPRK